MAILFESSTHIEFLLKNALIKEGLDFQEQYRVYEGGIFSEVKYVADFLLINENVRLIVECDGFYYHSGIDKLKKQIVRDDWLQTRGYIIVHFSTVELESNMYGVIQTIKYLLGLPSDTSRIIIKNDNTTNVKQKKQQNVPDDLFDVILFCYYRQIPSGICVVYKYKSISRNIWSEERKKVCENVPEDMLEITAIYLALLDIKRSVRLKICYNGYIYYDAYDVSKKFRRYMKRLLGGDAILKKNKISTSYVRIYEEYFRNKTEAQKTIRELRSRCLQISNNAEKLAAVQLFDYFKIGLHNNQFYT